jgi:hypothetical protein
LVRQISSLPVRWKFDLSTRSFEYPTRQQSSNCNRYRESGESYDEQMDIPGD